MRKKDRINMRSHWKLKIKSDKERRESMRKGVKVS